MKTGATGALISLPFAETPVGAAFMIASGITAAAGAATSAIGVGLQALGGGYLDLEGDSQPMLSAGLQAAQSQVEDAANVPPLPFDDPLDAVTNAAAGKDSCP